MAPHRRVRPHPAVHGRGTNERTARRQEHRREQIIGDAQRGFREEIRRGGGHEHGIGLFGQREMLHFLTRLEEAGRDRPARKHFER